MKKENPKRFKITDLPKIERPREKLIAKGPQNLKDLSRSELAGSAAGARSFNKN